MGAKQSSQGEDEDVTDDYEVLHQVRRQLFPDNLTDDQWRTALKDKVQYYIMYLSIHVSVTR